MTMASPARDSQRLWTPPAGPARAPGRVSLHRPQGRAGSGTDALLLDQLQRLARAPRGWVGLVLQPSLMPPPGPLAHHRRVALALMQDNARAHDGQVFALSNGDLVLLGPQRARPASLASLLLRLLRAPDRVASLWPLDSDAERLRSEIAARLEAHQANTGEADPAGAADGLTDSRPVVSVLHRQTALRPGERMRPLFREIRFSVSALEARLGLYDAVDDPYLVRYLSSRLDRHLLATLARALGDGGPLDTLAAGPEAVPIHLNLTLSGILSPEFDRYAEALGRAGGSGRAPAIEIAFLDACADPAGFAGAETRLERFGMAVVLDAVPHQALLLMHPGRLTAGPLKLDWSPHIARLTAAEQSAIDTAIAEIGPARIVLQQADSEAALHWGRSRGIRDFQGRHLEAMQAALRMRHCPASAACSLRQCRERASAGTRAGRRGCANPALLDQAVPGEARA